LMHRAFDSSGALA